MVAIDLFLMHCNERFRVMPANHEPDSRTETGRQAADHSLVVVMRVQHVPRHSGDPPGSLEELRSRGGAEHQSSIDRFTIRWFACWRM
jgi:hypothetical protein